MPKSDDIAKYILDNNLSADQLLIVLERYSAMSMLPNILKKLKWRHAEKHPRDVLELAHHDDEVLEKLSEHYALSTPKIIINPQIIGGYKVIKEYEMHDASVGGLVDRLFR